MNADPMLFPDCELRPDDTRTEPPTVPDVAPRLRRPERHQVEMRTASLDQLLPPDHQARVVWDFVTTLDLSPLLDDVRAVAHHPGQPANDPRLLMAVWLYATIDGVGSAREVARLCEAHIAYQWLCGGVSLSHKSLSDFRAANTALFNELLTENVATLLHQGLIDLQQVAQDGMRVRASAGASSFRRRPTLERCLQEARAQVTALENQVHEDGGAATRRQQAARERAARERQERLEQALREREQLVELRERQKREKGIKYDPEEIRVSTTDPEARRMKMPDGGTRPGFNVQLATTTGSGIIVGADVTNVGSDLGQLRPMAEQIEERTGETPAALLVDGGFTALDDIEHVEQNGTKVYGPIKDEEKKKAKGIDPYQPGRKDGPGVIDWRARMGTPEAKTIYRLRAQTAEWVNAGARNRGLYQVTVRGAQKVLAVVLLHALAHNLLRAVALRREKEAETVRR